MIRLLNDRIRHQAFTLAEVLITLAIIGVVAALTIPTLINTTQKMELKSAFKKEYSTLWNALKMVQFENGNSPYKCYNQSGSISDECNIFWAEMQMKMKGELCAPSGGVNCYPNYSNQLTAYSSYGALNTMQGYSPKTIMRLPDGSFILPNVYDFTNTSSAQNPEWFYIDVNGMKGPNKWGYDVYALRWQMVNDVVKINVEYYTLEDSSAMKATEILSGK